MLQCAQTVKGCGAGQIQNSASHGELRACVDIGHGNTPKDTVHPVVVNGKVGKLEKRGLSNPTRVPSLTSQTRTKRYCCDPVSIDSHDMSPADPVVCGEGSPHDRIPVQHT